MNSIHTQPVIRSVKYFMGHAPGLVRYGSKPSRELATDSELLGSIVNHLRTYRQASSYPPNQCYLGSRYPDELLELQQPWYLHNGATIRLHPDGEIIPEEELLGLMKLSDAFDLLHLESTFVATHVKPSLKRHPLINQEELQRLDGTLSYSEIESHVATDASTLPLYLRDGRLIGYINHAHDSDATLTADVLLENLACKATAAMALRALVNDGGVDPGSIEYIINSGEEAVGERYQRGGGNLAKAVGEMCGLENATGSDVKAFCCGPSHALVMAGALVNSGVFRQVAVVGGCSLAKLGMKFQGHLKEDQPILEDVLASVAVLVGPDDGVSPILRLDSVGRHNIGTSSSQQAIFEKLVSSPLEKLGLGFRDIDKYATELHNPEVTLPSGSGDVPKLNYRMIAALAVKSGQVNQEDMLAFVQAHGMPGYAPTQGHIASAVPFLGHAVRGLRDGSMQSAMFLAKGSLFLGRMTQMSDGMSFILERNPGL